MPDDFLTCEDVLKKHAKIINELLDAKLHKKKLDQIYDKIVDLYYAEMDKFLKEVKKAPASGKRVKHTKKPYWSEDLSMLWKHYHTCEKVYLSTPSNSRQLGNIREDFISAQNVFSKALKKAKRAFQRQQVYNLEKSNTSDPVEFWNSITCMGPKRSSGIPWEVVNENGESVTNKQQVLHRWMIDFRNLLTPPEATTLEAISFRQAIFEENENLLKSTANAEINIPFTTDEVKKIVDHAKKRKSPGD